MAQKRKTDETKLRTREHVIADLSINFVERRILLRGHSIRRIDKDYGLDLLMNTHNNIGEMENGHVQFQLKATDHIKLVQDGQAISVRMAVADVRWWQREAMPIILVIYDARRDRAFWLYVQKYLQEIDLDLSQISKNQDRVTFRIPTKNGLNQRAIDYFQKCRHNVVEQFKGVTHG